jgi:hypothetical protein
MSAYTETPARDYGVSTIERCKDGFNVTIVDCRLNIGAGFDRNRRACTLEELREAADKLNMHDELVKALSTLLDQVDNSFSASLPVTAFKDARDAARAALAKACVA